MLVAAHGNSLRALVKHLDGISDDDIAELNLPTGVPILYEMGPDMMPLAARPLAERYLGDADAARRRPRRSRQARPADRSDASVLIHTASSPSSPVRIRMIEASGDVQILPSPILSVPAAAMASFATGDGRGTSC